MNEIVHGHTDPAFEPLRDLLSQQLATGEEIGVSIHVRHAGRVLADLWAGRVGAPAAADAWERDTLVNIWSITKVVSTLAVLHAVDRGLLDLDAPVANSWPEFAAGGKASVTLAQLLSHTSGVCAWDPPFTLDNLYDHRYAASRLASQETWWTPGTASGYGATSFGTPLSELLRRAAGMPLHDYVTTYVAQPLGAGIYIGLPRALRSRAATLIPPTASPPPLAHDRPPLFKRTFTAPRVSAEATLTDAWRDADIGAANGHGNARSVALVGEAFLDDRLVRPAVRTRVFEAHSDGPDLVLGLPLQWGLGLALATKASFDYLPEGAGVWGGWGGSMLVIDPANHLVVAYVMNKMAPDLVGSERARLFLSQIYTLL